MQCACDAATAAAKKEEKRGSITRLRAYTCGNIKFKKRKCKTKQAMHLIPHPPPPYVTCIRAHNNSDYRGRAREKKKSFLMSCPPLILCGSGSAFRASTLAAQQGRKQMQNV